MAFTERLLFIIGGEDYPNKEVYKACEVFDFGMMVFRRIEDMNHPASCPAVCSFNDSYIL